MYRQGDVLIIALPMPHLATKMAPAPLEDGRVVLAHGEATGHAHAISPVITTDYVQTSVDNLEARLSSTDLDPLTAAVLRKQAEELHQFVDVLRAAGIEEHHQRAVLYGTNPDGDRFLDVQSEPGVLLDHEEHGLTPIPYGQHVIRIQREYEPAEGSIRVAD